MWATCGKSLPAGKSRVKRCSRVIVSKRADGVFRSLPCLHVALYLRRVLFLGQLDPTRKLIGPGQRNANRPVAPPFPALQKPLPGCDSCCLQLRFRPYGFGRTSNPRTCCVFRACLPIGGGKEGQKYGWWLLSRLAQWPAQGSQSGTFWRRTGVDPDASSGTAFQC